MSDPVTAYRAGDMARRGRERRLRGPGDALRAAVAGRGSELDERLLLTWRLYRRLIRVRGLYHPGSYWSDVETEERDEFDAYEAARAEYDSSRAADYGAYRASVPARRSGMFNRAKHVLRSMARALRYSAPDDAGGPA